MSRQTLLLEEWVDAAKTSGTILLTNQVSKRAIEASVASTYSNETIKPINVYQSGLVDALLGKII